jgi:hypothetical protein
MMENEQVTTGFDDQESEIFFFFSLSNVSWELMSGLIMINDFLNAYMPDVHYTSSEK